MKLLSSKKGQVFQSLAAMASGIAVLAIVLVVTFLVIAQGRTQGAQAESSNWSTDANSCAASTMCNSTNTLRTAISDIPGWVPLIVIASIGAVILGLVKLFGR